ncbi:hypothetical protein [Streptomyces sp. YIM S03343]
MSNDTNERAIPALPGPRSASYDPLHGPTDTPPYHGTFAQELDTIRQYLDQVATANIHDHTAMVKAAVGLDYRVRALLAALDAERGETR